MNTNFTEILLPDLFSFWEYFPLLPPKHSALARRATLRWIQVQHKMEEKARLIARQKKENDSTALGGGEAKKQNNYCSIFISNQILGLLKIFCKRQQRPRVTGDWALIRGAPRLRACTIGGSAKRLMWGWSGLLNNDHKIRAIIGGE